MDNNVNNPKRLFKRKFRKVAYELDYLEIKIDQVEGIIFKNHRYSQAELLDSPHHRRIDSITRKIGDDASHWYAKGSLSEQGLAVYDEKREDIDERLHHINILIENRLPTWWESVKGGLNDFAVKIAQNMPKIKRFLIESARILNLPFLEKLTTPLLLGLDKVLREKNA